MLNFEWNSEKEFINICKHGVDFWTALQVFDDLDRCIIEDLKHHEFEERHLCIGKVRGRILTVRFVYREENIRIIGAGYWRKGKQLYEKKKKST